MLDITVYCDDKEIKVEKIITVGEQVKIYCKPVTAEKESVIENTDLMGKILDIVSEQLMIDKSKVTPSARFVQELGADSLDTVELCMCFEEEFEFEMPDEEAEKIITVRDAYDYIKGKISG